MSVLKRPIKGSAMVGGPDGDLQYAVAPSKQGAKMIVDGEGVTVTRTKNTQYENYLQLLLLSNVFPYLTVRILRGCIAFAIW